ncbi:MAG: radical SAM family heme chaperone HemW, partial [Phycisphaerales bacterium]
FYSIVDTRSRQPEFVERLKGELEALSRFDPRPIRTIFVGGGTPSLLAPELWKDLLYHLHSRFDLTKLQEFTVECNPETVTAELMAVLAAGGVDRVSMGAQSFDPRHLQTLERWHNPESVPVALDLARRAGIRRDSIDLIYAIPGQTIDDWRSDLTRALSLGTRHLSCYNLTYEPNTAMTSRLAKGEFAPTDEDTEVDMFLLTAELLRDAGLRRYEVSNYAAPGHECLHNLAYWRQEEWLAAGPSASAHVAGHRWKNLPRLDDYLSLELDGLSFATDHEPSDQRRALGERLMTGLRLAEGIPLAEVLGASAGLGEGVSERVGRVRDRHVAQGNMTDDPLLLVLTDAGILIENRVTVDFLRALDPR